MKTLTMRDLNRKTASVLDAIERGEAFEVRRNGRAVGHLTPTPPISQCQPDWKTHFDWLRACFENRSGKGLRARRGGWRGATRAHIREKSVTEEQRSQPPRPAARPPEIFSKRALRKQTTKTDAKILGEFEEDRRQQAVREQELGNLK